MNISGLTLDEVNEKIKEYYPTFIGDDFKFQENYQMEFGEISHNISKKYHKFFNDSDIINNASGLVEADKFDFDYTLILLSNEDQSQALFLILQSEDKATGDIKIDVLKSFICEHTSCLTDAQLDRYKKHLADMQDFIQSNSDKLKTGKIGEEFKKRLLMLIVQTTTILEEYY
jgi:hypothetical protein